MDRKFWKDALTIVYPFGCYWLMSCHSTPGGGRDDVGAGVLGGQDPIEQLSGETPGLLDQDVSHVGELKFVVARLPVTQGTDRGRCSKTRSASTKPSWFGHYLQAGIFNSSGCRN
jgi:hypothetical protein